MTELRRRMTDDMVVRWMAKATQEAYLAAVVGLADLSPVAGSDLGCGGPSLSAPSHDSVAALTG